MQNVTILLLATPLVVVCAALAAPNGGYIQGTVKLAKSITSWEKVVVVICAETDPTCDKPTAVSNPTLPSRRHEVRLTHHLGCQPGNTLFTL